MLAELFTAVLLPSAALAQLSPFHIMVTRSASPIHFGQVNANGRNFWIGKEPSAYCPPEIENLNCSIFSGNETVFLGGEGGMSLDVVVPGGQQVYIAPDGALSYTGPHSAYIPEGSITTGWTRTPATGEGQPWDYLNWTGGLLACPKGDNSTFGSPYQIYGKVERAEGWEGCLGFNALAINYTASIAPTWEYT